MPKPVVAIFFHRTILRIGRLQPRLFLLAPGDLLLHQSLVLRGHGNRDLPEPRRHIRQKADATLSECAVIRLQHQPVGQLASDDDSL